MCIDTRAWQSLCVCLTTQAASPARRGDSGTPSPRFARMHSARRRPRRSFIYRCPYTRHTVDLCTALRSWNSYVIVMPTRRVLSTAARSRRGPAQSPPPGVSSSRCTRIPPRLTVSSYRLMFAFLDRDRFDLGLHLLLNVQ